MARSKRTLAETDANAGAAPAAKRVSTGKGKMKSKENDAPHLTAKDKTAAGIPHTCTRLRQHFLLGILQCKGSCLQGTGILYGQGSQGSRGRGWEDLDVHLSCSGQPVWNRQELCMRSICSCKPGRDVGRHQEWTRLAQRMGTGAIPTGSR